MDVHEGDKQGLLIRLLDAVKQCQVRFGGKSELATEADARVCCLCGAWEAVLNHGLKHTNKALSTLKQVTEITGLAKTGIGFMDDIKKLETEPTCWAYIREHLSKHDLQRYSMLKSISSDAGRGRAWLRATLNEHSMERYMHMMVEREDLLSQYYEEWAFVRDQERASMLPSMAAGLGSILFAISIDREELNTIKPATGLDSLLSTSAPARPSGFQRYDEEPRPVIAGDGSSPPLERKKQREKKRKKKVVKIVSFDEEDLSSHSASPASSVTSPHSLSSGVDIGVVSGYRTGVACQRGVAIRGTGNGRETDYRPDIRPQSSTETDLSQEDIDRLRGLSFSESDEPSTNDKAMGNTIPGKSTELDNEVFSSPVKQEDNSCFKVEEQTGSNEQQAESPKSEDSFLGKTKKKKVPTATLR